MADCHGKPSSETRGGPHAHNSKKSNGHAMSATKTKTTKEKNPGATPPFLGVVGNDRKETKKSPLPGSVAEARYLTLGGVDQWVLVRGRDVRTNPVLVMLHGGPGISETHLWRYFNSDVLERIFTVVYWDQRGSGKSYDPETVPKRSMTVEQFLLDLDELVDAVRARFDKDTVVLFGHSWGSALGPLYAHRFPDKVSAYVGCGQLGDWSASERKTYAYALAEAERRKMHRAVRELRRVGEPPHDCDGLCTQRKWLAELDGDTSWSGIWQMIKVFYYAPEASVFDLLRFYDILKYSIDATWTEVTSLNLIEAVKELKMPTFFLLGRHDHCVMPDISSEFIDALKAPSKQVVWFEESKHMPFMDEPDKFNKTMEELVRPSLDGTKL